jgi:hypothetical protein
MTNMPITIIVVGYKDRGLLDFVNHLKAVTRSQNIVLITDQHPISHEEEFSSLKGCHYDHLIWDSIEGPAQHRSKRILDAVSYSDYICVMSPDISLKDGWDIDLINKLKSDRVVLSGSGSVSVANKDIFSLHAEYTASSDYNVTQFIDRNFIFAKSDVLSQIVFSDLLKYNGENEYLSLAILSAGYDIVSVPTDTYVDSHIRSVENTYHTFSIEHNYNVVVDMLNGIGLSDYKISGEALLKFLDFHGLSIGQIKKLPYSTNDVSYDPYKLKMHGVDARRFIAGTKAVY